MRPLVAALSMLSVTTTSIAAQVSPPPGWGWHHDTRGTSADSADWRFSMMPPGFHLTTTTTGVTLFPTGSTMTGRRAAEVKVILFPGKETSEYGLVIVNIDDPTEWMGVLVTRDGAILTSARPGRTGLRGTEHGPEGVAVPDSSGYATNILRVEVGVDSATFLANGKRIGVIPRAALPKRAEVGFRMGMGLNMHVTIFDLITPLAPARP